ATGAGTWSVTNLSGSIAPGQYYLVQEAGGSGGTTNLPPPDAVGTINLAATAGKVAVVNVTTHYQEHVQAAQLSLTWSVMEARRRVSRAVGRRQPRAATICNRRCKIPTVAPTLTITTSTSLRELRTRATARVR